MLLPFQFSLWDSKILEYPNICRTATFNSLYEILYSTQRLFVSAYFLSILFMRFYWPAIRPVYSFFLSILFMRFFSIFITIRISNYSFNSLYEIHLILKSGTTITASVFQFSLWDSTLGKNAFRFWYTAFNSLYEIHRGWHPRNC